MIENISINNYALIDHTHIELEKGFSVITGETGAGKSILLGAIGLTLGQRADSSAIMDKTKNIPTLPPIKPPPRHTPVSIRA